MEGEGEGRMFFAAHREGEQEQIDLYDLYIGEMICC